MTETAAAAASRLLRGEGAPPPSGADDAAAIPASKQRLLDAAEQCFAARGFEGASLRVVTRAAGMSVSAANYHFGSKQELLVAVIRRRVRPLNERRLATLDAIEARAGQGGALELEALLDAFFRPAFEHIAAARRQRQSALPRQFIARFYFDPPERARALRAEIFGEVNARFYAAFQRALPGATDAALRLFQQFAIATMVHLLSGQVDDALTSELAAAAAPDEAPHEPLLRALITHVAAGGRALAAEGAGR